MHSFPSTGVNFIVSLDREAALEVRGGQNDLVSDQLGVAQAHLAEPRDFLAQPRAQSGDGLRNLSQLRRVRSRATQSHSAQRI